MSESTLRRILMTGDTVGGVWTYTLELAESLEPHGIEVLLAAMGGPPNETQRAEARRIPNLRLVASNFKLEWMDDPWDDVAESGRWVLSLEEQFDPDVVHLNSYGHGALAWRNPFIVTAHSCVLSWWDAVKRERLPDRWNRYRDEVARSLKAADVLTTPSRAMLQAVESHYGPGLPGCRLVVPNGRSARLFQTAKKEPFVLSAGRLWDEAKNMEAVTCVASKLPWPVYLAGEARSPDGAAVHVENCRTLGRLSAAELAAWYARASIYALPARYEPFGLSALEAGLAGCVLVLGDIASLREIWGDAALYVPPDDCDRLEAVLRELIANPPLRLTMARDAATRAREFTPDRMASGYLGAYKTALGKRSSVCVS